ncbi:MAG: efflux RND transporter periplasmic adaptor subunit [Magnetococcales bacterium]|nr:efflux RND transporter periplasmic adaptor subunit [Magnetococcales bacterium]
MDRRLRRHPNPMKPGTIKVISILFPLLSGFFQEAVAATFSAPSQPPTESVTIPVAADRPAPSALPDALHADSLRAQILPRDYTTLSSELPARLVRIHVAEGGRFKAGEPLVTLDCAIQQAQLQKARVVLAAAEKVSAVNARLVEMKSAGRMEEVTSAAEAAKARAEVALMTATVAKCILLAPFSGRVAEQKGRQHQYVQAGQAILDLIDDSAMEIEFIVPSRWLRWMSPHLPFVLQVDETGRDYPAQVLRIGARVDAVSQSIKVTGRFQEKPTDLLPGMSGRVMLNPPPTVPP